MDTFENICGLFGIETNDLDEVISKLTFEHFLNNDLFLLDPHFCEDFALKHVAVIEIEMSSKYVTRSIMDTKFTFEGQLASLGEIYINFLTVSIVVLLVVVVG